MIQGERQDTVIEAAEALLHLEEHLNIDLILSEQEVLAGAFSRFDEAIIDMTKHAESATSEETGPRLTKEEAIELLAQELQFKTEHLDPGEGGWAELDERSRNFYRLCVKWLLAHATIVRAALGQ